MEETFYNTELKNKIKKSEKRRGKKTWPPWNKSSILRRERNTAEHRWGWCPFCVLCVSVCNSFRIAAVWAGATGAAAPGLGGAAAAEPGRASGGSRAGFLCGEEGSDGITCKELKQKRFAHSLHPPRLPSQLRFAGAAYLPAAFACCNKACPANGWQSFSGCRWPWNSGIRTGALREGNVLHSPTVLKVSTASRASVQPLITRNPAWLVRSWKKLILHWKNILYYLSRYCTTWRLGLFLIPQWRKIICWMFRGTGLYAQSCTG